MADLDEVQILEAMAARVARIDSTDGYYNTLALNADDDPNVPLQRIDFDSFLDYLPLVGVVIHKGDFRDVGVSPRFADQVTTIELVGCQAATADGLQALRMLADMKKAAFTPMAAGPDAFDSCAVLSAVEYYVFLARNGESFTQVSLFLEAQWGDHSVLQGDD